MTSLAEKGYSEMLPRGPRKLKPHITRELDVL